MLGIIRKFCNYFLQYNIKKMKGVVILIALINLAIATDTFNDSVPPGVIVAFASEVIPSDYLECNGQTVSATGYAELFSVIQY